MLVGGAADGHRRARRWVVASNRRAFQEVARFNAQLRTLSWRMLRCRRTSSARSSRELHDDFGQIVTASARCSGGRRHAAGEAGLVRAGAGADDRAADARPHPHRSQWLHPGRARRLRPGARARRCVEQFQRQTGIQTHLAASGPLDSVREDCAIHVYRIVQEALSNAAGIRDRRKRGCGSTAATATCSSTSRIMAAASPRRRRRRPARGMGMVSMRERAELIGGELHVAPAQGGGTVVQLRVHGCLAPAASEVA